LGSTGVYPTPERHNAMFTNKTFNNIVLKSIVIAEEKISAIKEIVPTTVDKIKSTVNKIITTVKEKIDSMKESFFAAKWMVSMMLA